MKKPLHFKRWLTLACSTAIGVQMAMAVPARPTPITYELPDNTTVKVILRGDENCHWAETLDGYTLIKADNQYLNFATTNEKGEMVNSGVRYTGTTDIAKMAGIKPGVHYTAEQVKKMRKYRKAPANHDLMLNNTFPVSGKVKMLMLLVNFADTKTTYTRQNFDDLMNQKDYKGIGSFRDYFLEQSYGKFDVETTVVDWITLPYTKAQYGTENIVYIIAHALDAVADQIDLSQFDNDGDGVLDGLAVIHQGYGYESSYNDADIWSHSDEVEGLEYDGIKISTYTIQPEKQMANFGVDPIMPIGVVAHEFGHNLGAPDFYDSSYSSSPYPGTGNWDLMCHGPWNSEGNRPAGINMWQKIVFGWVDPVTLNADTSITGMKAANEKAEAYRIDTTEKGDYFILENRQKSGPFDQALPGSGLLIYHANDGLVESRVNYNTMNTTYPQAVYLVNANGVEPYNDPNSYGESALTDAPYGNGVSEFSDNTTPSALSDHKQKSYMALSNITNKNGEVSFDFAMTEAPASPLNFKAMAKEKNVELSWEKPEGAAPTNYTLFCNNAELATVDETKFTHESPADDEVLNYSIYANYATGNSRFADAECRIVPNKASNISAKTLDEMGKVGVQWKVGTSLSRVNNFYSPKQTAFEASELNYGQLYTVDDLRTFVGCKISRVTFVPTQDDTQYKVCIWKADADGSNRQLVSEDAVSNVTAGSSRDISLGTPVVIEAGKQYIIGVNCKNSLGRISASIEGEEGTLHKGLGNLMSVNGGEWATADNITSDFLVSAQVTVVTVKEMAEMPAIDSNVDAVNDMVFPIGFRIYRDGELVGESSSRYFIDRNVTSDYHTYRITSLYKGGSESSGVEKEIDIDFSGVETIEGTSASIKAMADGIEITGANGTVTITDLAGRNVFEATTDGFTFAPLTQGIYIVKVGGKATKVIVK